MLDFLRDVKGGPFSCNRASEPKRVASIVAMDSNALQIRLRKDKGGVDRDVPITQELAEQIRLHIRYRRSGPLFRSSHGGTYSARRIQQIVKEVATEADIIKRVHPHKLRRL